MAFLRRSLTGLLALLTITTAALAVPAASASADAGDAVAGTPRASAGRIAAGERHTCALTSLPGEGAGSVRCWGNNSLGQLGLGDTDNRGDQPGELGSALPAVDLGRPATSIAAGYAHTCAILDDGDLKCWGDNSLGQLGTGDLASRGDAPGEMGATLPAVDLGAGRTARMVAAGIGHTCALLDDGAVRCWGDGALGQLGNGAASAGDVVLNTPADVDLGPNRTAISITAGGSHTCAILDTHQVKCWGSNEYGQLGLGDTNHRGDAPGEMGASLPVVDLGTGMTARTITAGRFHTCALLTDAIVRCWGLNDHGQLAQFDTVTRGDDAGETGDAIPALEFPADTMLSITATAFGTCVVSALEPSHFNNAKCWGENDHGQLGAGNTDDYGTGGSVFTLASNQIGRVLALSGGGDHVCGVTEATTVRCVGANDSGQLGIGTTDDRGDQNGEATSVPTVELRRPASIAQIDGGSHTCAILTDGALKCWGPNTFGGLGLGDTVTRGKVSAEMGDALPAIDLGTGRTATQVSVGDGATCAVLDNGQVKCWGWNFYGQLGLGDTSNRGDEPGEMGNALPAIDLGTGRTATRVSIGTTNACALLDNEQLKCWGHNAQGQLATGDGAARGDGPGEMGDALAGISFGDGRHAIDVVVGNSATCAVLDDHSMTCWGYGPGGQLGRETADIVWGSDPSHLGVMPPVVLPSGRTVVDVDGVNTWCAILDDASVVCWGRNEYGEAGVGTTDAIGNDAGEMGDDLIRVPLPTGQTPIEIDAGLRHTCVRFVSTQVQCWGYNADGELGIDQLGNRGDEPGELGSVLPTVNFGNPTQVTQLTSGQLHTCALLGSDRLVCWGNGEGGALGAPPSSDRGVPSRPVAAAAMTEVGGVPNKLVPFIVTPAIPTGITATAGVESAALAWTAPATDGGSPVSGYRIERSVDGGDVWTVLVANTGTTATTRTITGLTAGQAIRFRVAAINAAGPSAASLPSASVAPTAPVVPPVVPPVDPQPTKPAKFVPLTPGRIADTRPDGATVDGQGVGPGVLAAGETLTVQVTGRANVPAGAAAAVLNVTAVTPDGPGFLTVYPCDAAERPNASSVNYQAGQVVPNAVISKLSAAGTVCVYTLATTHVLVDVTGAYPAGAAYLPVTPARVADTRPGGQTVDGQGQATGILGNQFVAVLTVQVTGRADVPAGATAAVLNVTAVTPDRAGYLTVFPCDRDQPNASSVNFQAGQIVANAVVTKLAADGTVCIASSAESTHVLVDVVGAFPAGADYTPLVPARFADTRAGGITVDGAGAATGLLGAGQTLTVQVAGRDQVPGGATSAVLNVTAVTPSGPGFLTVYPCDAPERPNASSVNYQAGQVVPNAVITKLAADGTVCVFTLAATHVLVDVTGAS